MKHFYKCWLHEQQIFTRVTFFKWSRYISLEISLQDVERPTICIEGHGKANIEVSSRVSEHTLHALIETRKYHRIVYMHLWMWMGHTLYSHWHTSTVFEQMPGLLGLHLQKTKTCTRWPFEVLCCWYKYVAGNIVDIQIHWGTYRWGPTTLWNVTLDSK